jgi:ABC-type antimicrobial peptide transport system permease subunit
VRPLNPPAPFAFEVSGQPRRIGQVRTVQDLPTVFAGLLCILAVAAVGHALFSSIRGRAAEVGVLRALGLTPRQSRLVLAVQATMIALVALLFGLPLGVAAGRLLWRVVADRTPVLFVPPTSASVLLLAVPVVVVLANALGLLPAQRLARMRLADVLRTE